MLVVGAPHGPHHLSHVASAYFVYRSFGCEHSSNCSGLQRRHTGNLALVSKLPAAVYGVQSCPTCPTRQGRRPYCRPALPRTPPPLYRHAFLFPSVAMCPSISGAFGGRSCGTSCALAPSSLCTSISRETGARRVEERLTATAAWYSACRGITDNVTEWKMSHDRLKTRNPWALSPVSSKSRPERCL